MNFKLETIYDHHDSNADSLIELLRSNDLTPITIDFSVSQFDLNCSQSNVSLTKRNNHKYDEHESTIEGDSIDTTSYSWTISNETCSHQDSNFSLDVSQIVESHQQLKKDEHEYDLNDFFFYTDEDFEKLIDY